MNIAVSSVRLVTSRYIMASNDREMAETEKEVQARFAGLDAIRKRYEPLIVNAEERSVYESFSKNWDVYRQLNDKLMVLARAHKSEEAEMFFLNDCSRRPRRRTPTRRQHRVKSISRARIRRSRSLPPTTTGPAWSSW